MMADKRRHPFTVVAWILVGAVVLATTFGVVGGILSRSLVVDLVAMWPLGALAAVAGMVGWWRGRRRNARSGAVLPLALFTAVVLAMAVHLGGWESLPSGTARLEGPPAEELSDPTRLTAHISGDLVVNAGAGATGYEVKPIFRGGDVGVPEALETSVDGDLTITLDADPTVPSWYRFSGWELALSPGVGWRLVLNGVIDADLSALRVDALAIAGQGTVALPEPAGEVTAMVISGEFTVTVPADAAVEVQGEAQIPDGWDSSESGSTSPEFGQSPTAWRIRVEGEAPVRVLER